MRGKDTGLRNSVFQGFQRVKNDIERQNIRIMLLEAENKRLKEEMERFKNKPKEEYSRQETPQNTESQESLSIETLRLELRKIISEELKRQNTKAASVFSTETETEINPEPLIKRQTPSDKLKEDLLRNYERNRKDIVKQQILTEAAKGSHTKIQLRDIVVDQKKYCSKASFYRYLEELELSGALQQRRQQKRTVLVTEMTS